MFELQSSTSYPCPRIEPIGVRIYYLIFPNSQHSGFAQLAQNLILLHTEGFTWTNDRYNLAVIFDIGHKSFRSTAKTGKKIFRVLHYWCCLPFCTSRCNPICGCFRMTITCPPTESDIVYSSIFSLACGKTVARHSIKAAAILAWLQKRSNHRHRWFLHYRTDTIFLHVLWCYISVYAIGPKFYIESVISVMEKILHDCGDLLLLESGRL